MNPTRWQRLQDLVEAAALLPETDRLPFVARELPDDPDLRRQVEGMLLAYQTSGLFEDAIAFAAASAVTPELLNPGDRLGPWQVLALVGHGGMGSVFRAERVDGQFQQQAAIKLVRLGPGAPAGLLLRFRAERQILASISHPNIARLLDGGITPSGLPYLVMEFVDGEPLDRYLARTNPGLPARLALFQGICAAAQHAHQNLVVHRDLKPANILVTPDGTPRLLDFGIAKLLGDSAIPADAAHTELTGRLMTPEYASPEQIRGEPITTSTDIYSLGVVLYEILTGTRPFQLNHLSPAEMERCIAETRPRPPSALTTRSSRPRLLQLFVGQRRSSDLDRIVLKSMHKNPERRYSSVAGLSSDIDRYRSGFPVIARPDSLGYRTRLFLARHRLAVSAAVLVLLTIVGLSITALVLAARARQEAAAANSVSTFLTGLFEQARPDATHGRSTSARDLLDHGTATLQTTTAPIGQGIADPLIRARLLSTLGRVYFDLGDMQPAATLLSEAEAIYLQHPGQDLLHLAETENNLGTLEIDRSDAAAAIRHNQQAIALYTRLKGPNSPEVADILDNLGVLQNTLGHFDRAQQLLEQAVAMHARTLGPDAEPTLVDKHNLASLYGHLGDYRRELPLLTDVLAAHRRTIGDLQEATTSDLGNLAWLEDRLNHLTHAEALNREAIANKARLFGADNPRLAMQYLTLADILRKQGRLDDAQAAITTSLRLMRAFEGPSSLHLAYALDIQGLIALDRNDRNDRNDRHDLSAARESLEQALHIRESKSPQPLADLALSYDHLGKLALAQNDPAAAEPLLRHALAIEQTAFPGPTDATATTDTSLAQALLAQHRTPEACTLLHEAIATARSTFADPAHPILLTAEATATAAACPR